MGTSRKLLGGPQSTTSTSKRPQRRAKTDKQRSNNPFKVASLRHPKTDAYKGSVLDRLGAIWGRLGSVLASQKPPKINQKTIQMQRSKNLEKHKENHCFYLKPKSDLKTTQDGPQDGPKLDLEWGSIFSSVLGCFWEA